MSDDPAPAGNAPAAGQSRATGLVDRHVLEDRLARALLRAGATDRPCALLILDLDRFKEINEALNFEAGDEVLGEIARRLRDCLGPADTIARMGGDSFALIAEDLNHATSAVHLAEQVLGTVTPPTFLENYDVSLSASVGIAVGAGLPAEQAGSAEPAARQLLRDADMAMHWAKKAGGNRFRFHDDSMNQTARQRIAVETGLRRALADERIEVYYQPQLRAADHRLIGVEALVRWRDQEGTLHNPHEFLQIAEDTALIVPISQVVLEQACQQVRTWVRYTGRSLKLAVNVAQRWFFDPAMPATIQRVLHETSLPPQSLELELTEHVLLTDTERAAQVISELRDMGVGIALDDFGTGYASLNYLRRLPIDVIKVDRSFIQDLPQTRADQAIVDALIRLANELEIEVVAEGVESAAQAHMLTQRGATRLQGFHFSLPRSGPALEGYILDRALNTAQSPDQDD